MNSLSPNIDFQIYFCQYPEQVSKYSGWAKGWATDGQRFDCQQAPRIRSVSKSPDRPWDPPNGYKELLLQENTGRVVKPITHLILGLRVSIHGAVPPFPACLHGQRPLSSFRRNSRFQTPVQQSLFLTTTPCRSTAADYISGQHNLRSATTWT